MVQKKLQLKDIEEERMGMFMTNDSFDLDVMYGRNYLQTDNAQKLWIHKVNVIETKSTSFYGQAKAKDKKFMPPVEIDVMVGVADSQQEYYGNNPGGIARDDTGPLSFGVYLKELEEKNLDIIKGDIVEYNMSGQKKRYYEVENANNITDETAKTIGGFKPYWRKITAIPVKEDVVPFLSETKGR